MYPHRGDTPLTVELCDGEKLEFTLCYDLNAVKMLGKKDIDLEKFNNIGLADFDKVLDLIHIGLLRHQPKMKVEEVGQIDWDLPAVVEAVGKAIERAYGDAIKKAAKKKATTSPSTGKNSKSSPTVSA